MSELLFNELPRPTFRWLRVNHTVSSLAGEDTSVQSIAVEANKDILSPLPFLLQPYQLLSHRIRLNS
ncbi:SufBD protein [human gut metagenome]|uniref:SufBD protein n=1 Tax=human gut metagenome TaxID=408170 RepID=W1XMU6_9ZZZZ